MEMVLPPPALLPGEKDPPNQEPVVRAVLEESMLRSLNRLDEALGPKNPRSSYITIRVIMGVKDHFRARALEWGTALLMTQFGWILQGPESVFSHSPNLQVMGQWMSEEKWGVCCLVLGLVHLAALTVNGTFSSFKYSPHIRAISSFLACYMWFQITLAIFLSGVGGTGLGTYRLVLVFELANFIFACMDVGKTEARRKVNGK